MLRSLRTLAALVLVLGLSAPASAVPVDFELSVDRVMGADDVITFTVSLVETTNITGYNLTVQYDPDELQWNESMDLMGGLEATPQPGDDQHYTGGLRVSALAFSRIAATDLFSISFIVTSPVADAAFDDFRVFLAPGGCELLPEGCNRVPPPPGCDPSVDATCDDIPDDGSGLSEFPGDPSVEIGNLGFKVEVGPESHEVMAIPEPALGLLLASGLLPLWRSRRR
jgi:hypothetical protein